MPFTWECMPKTFFYDKTKGKMTCRDCADSTFPWQSAPEYNIMQKEIADKSV